MNFKNVLSTILLLLFCCSGLSAQTNKQLKWMKDHPRHPKTRQWIKDHPEHPIVLEIKKRRAGDVQAGTAKPQQLPRVAPPIRKQELAAIDRKEKEALAGIDLEEEREKTARLEKNLAERKGKSAGLSSSTKLLEKLEQKLADQKAIQQFRISMFHRVTEDSEQGRRRVKVQHPIQGDVRYTEHKGKFLNDKELAVVQKAEKWEKERWATIKEVGKTARTAADAYIRSIQETGIIRLDACTPIGQTRTDPPYEVVKPNVKDWTNVWYEVEYVSEAGIRIQRKVYVSVIQLSDKGEPSESLWMVSPREKALEIMGNWLPPVNRIR